MADQRVPMAYVQGMLATDLVQIADLRAHPELLHRGGWWAVAATFEGAITGYRFHTVRRAQLPTSGGGWSGPTGPWVSSLDRTDFLVGVQAIREHIAAGEVYQVNLCRVLTADLPPGSDPVELAALLAKGNPAPYAGLLDTGDDWIVSASPELFLRRAGDTISSAPMKGTTVPGLPFAGKDVPENVMITDLVRNDLGRIARTGSVQVRRLLAREEHPGIAHLVSEVIGILRPGLCWQEILAATFPPGSVSGAPKLRALEVIQTVEPVRRGPYCGAIGYIDASRDEACLAVGIRTFFTSEAGRRLHFGTGAGITYASDPEQEWAETELKAHRLIALATGQDHSP